MWRLGGHKHKLPPLEAIDKHLAIEFQCSQVITSQTKNKMKNENTTKFYQMYLSFKFQNFQLLKMMCDDIFNQ